MIDVDLLLLQVKLPDLFAVDAVFRCCVLLGSIARLSRYKLLFRCDILCGVVPSCLVGLLLACFCLCERNGRTWLFGFRSLQDFFRLTLINDWLVELARRLRTIYCVVWVARVVMKETHTLFPLKKVIVAATSWYTSLLWIAFIRGTGLCNLVCNHWFVESGTWEIVLFLSWSSYADSKWFWHICKVGQIAFPKGAVLLNFTVCKSGRT
jgi:hypothetical protein